MNKLITTAIACLTTACSFVGANEESSKGFEQYGYLNLGFGPAPIPIPQFGGGYRLQKGHHGFDVNAEVTTVVSITALKSSLNYLYYLKPDLCKEFYVGVGPAVAGLFFSHEIDSKPAYAISPQLIFGKKYTSDTGSPRHFQANILWPAFWGKKTEKTFYTIDHEVTIHSSKSDIMWFPMVSISYAWGF